MDPTSGPAPKPSKETRQLAYRFNSARRWDRNRARAIYDSDEDLARALWQLAPGSFQQTTTHKLFETVVSRLRRDPDEVTPDILRTIVNNAVEMPVLEFHVVRPVAGVVFKDPVNRLGRTTVWAPASLREEMKQWPGETNLAMGSLSDQPVAEVRVRARTAEAAKLLGDRALREFEALMRIATAGTSGTTDFTIFDAPGTALLSYIVSSELSVVTGSSVAGPMVEMEFTQAELLADHGVCPMDALWSIHGRHDRTPVEKKITTAAHWFSLARRELDPIKSVPFAWFAVEAILPYSSAESTRSQIARWSSHLLDVSIANAEVRRKRLAELYDVRSDIAHGRASDLTDELRQEVLTLVEFLLNNACDDSIRHAADEKRYGEAIIARSLVASEERERLSTKGQTVDEPPPTADVYRVAKTIRNDFGDGRPPPY